MVALLVAPGAIEAQDASSESHDPTDIQYRSSVDVPLTVAAIAAWGLPALLQGPAPCRWCERSPDGRDSLNRLDRTVRDAWRWHDPGPAAKLGDLSLGLAIAIPVGALIVSHGDFDEGFGRDVLVVLEATAISGALTQVAKYSTRRERPWAHFDDVPPGETLDSAGSTLSFFSGHTSIAFAVVASSGAVASIRGDRSARWIWGTGFGVAAATGYFRVAADRHYLSDVLVGALVGTTVGLAVPHLLHRARRSPEPNAVPAPERSGAAAGIPSPRGATAQAHVMLHAGLLHGGPFVVASWSW